MCPTKEEFQKKEEKKTFQTLSETELREAMDDETPPEERFQRENFFRT